MKNLFAYGTLMCEDIMCEVSGYRLAHKHGILKGYSRRSVLGENYPAIKPDKKGVVDGLLYLNVPSLGWERLDRFEGEMYERHHVTVVLIDQTTMSAQTYIIHPLYLDRLDQSDWDFDNFIRNGKENFQRHYKGYGAL